MNLQDWSDITQLIGNVAVIATLIVVIAQIRANTRAVNLERAEARLSKFTTPFYQSPHLLRISAKIDAVQGQGPATKELMETFDLSPEEANLWFRHLMDQWTTYEIEWRHGVLGHARGIKRSQRFLDNRIFYKHLKLGRDPAFIRYVDSLLADSSDES